MSARIIAGFLRPWEYKGIEVNTHKYEVKGRIPLSPKGDSPRR